MNAGLLHEVLLRHADKLRVRQEAAEECGDAAGVDLLRDTRYLVLALTHVVNGVSIQRAMGTPGEWGYDTPMGKALAAAEVQA